MNDKKCGRLVVKCTCNACPEQYDILYEDEVICYVRLRWGFLTASMKKDRIFEKQIGDNMQGSFESQSERKFYLTEIIKKISIELDLDKVLVIYE